MEISLGLFFFILTDSSDDGPPSFTVRQDSLSGLTYDESPKSLVREGMSKIKNPKQKRVGYKRRVKTTVTFCPSFSIN